MLLDPETLALAPGVERLLPAEGLKTELFSCLVETNTPVCETALEARDELVRLRRLVVELAGARGSPSPRPDRIRSRSRRSSGSSRSRATGRWSTSSAPSRRASSCAASTSTSGWRASMRASARSKGSGPGWRRAPPLGELAVPRRRGDRRALVAARPLRRVAAGRPAAALATVADWEAARRSGRGRLHADLVGRTPSPAARDARGADRRPGDVRRALRRPRRAGAGALRGAAGARCRPDRRGRARGAGARHVGARDDAARAGRGRAPARGRSARTGSRRLQRIS